MDFFPNPSNCSSSSLWFKSLKISDWSLIKPSFTSVVIISCPKPSISKAFLETKWMRLPFKISGHVKSDEHLINAALFIISFNSNLSKSDSIK